MAPSYQRHEHLLTTVAPDRDENDDGDAEKSDDGRKSAVQRVEVHRTVDRLRTERVRGTDSRRQVGAAILPICGQQRRQTTNVIRCTQQ